MLRFALTAVIIVSGVWYSDLVILWGNVLHIPVWILVVILLVSFVIFLPVFPVVVIVWRSCIIHIDPASYNWYLTTVNFCI